MLKFSSGLAPAKPASAGRRRSISFLHVRTEVKGERIELSDFSGCEEIFAL